ncbi:MAG: alpha/beta hydrolase, partial [Telluria sp.]
MKSICLVFMFCIAGAAAAAPSAYVLDNTEVRDIRAQALKRDYQLFVALPDSYRDSSQRYPVVFVTDANYA